MALIGGQILSSVKAAGLIERRQTAMLLAESISGRLQAGGFELSDQAQQMADTFGLAYPGWGWRVSTETTDDPSLMRVHLQVLQGDPTQSNVPVEAMASVTDMYTFWALPAKMDPATDLGLSDTDLKKMKEGGFDPGDPTTWSGANLTSLLAEYPQLATLLKMYGIDPSMIASMDPDTVRKAVETYMAANGGSLPNIPGLGGGTNPGGGSNPGGGRSGGNNGGSNPGGGSNNNNNSNNNSSGGALDWNEIARLMNSGDKAALEEYVRTHSGTPAGGSNTNAGGGNTGGGRGGSTSGGNTGGRGGTGTGGTGRGRSGG